MRCAWISDEGGNGDLERYRNYIEKRKGSSSQSAFEGFQNRPMFQGRGLFSGFAFRLHSNDMVPVTAEGEAYRDSTQSLRYIAVPMATSF